MSNLRIPGWVGQAEAFRGGVNVIARDVAHSQVELLMLSM